MSELLLPGARTGWVMRLDTYWINECYETGGAIYDDCRGKNQKCLINFPHSRYDEINSYGAERATGLAINVTFIKQLRADKTGDVAKDIQVRHRPKGASLLIFREGDDESHQFILVRGNMPAYRIVGWLWGWEIRHFGKSMKEEWKQYGDIECWTVPNFNTRPMDTWRRPETFDPSERRLPTHDYVY